MYEFNLSWPRSHASIFKTHTTWVYFILSEVERLAFLCIVGWAYLVANESSILASYLWLASSTA